MIVYVESNFVLQISLDQEEASSAESILQQAENEAIALSVPAFSIYEPFSTIAYRGLERTRLFNTLDNQLVQLRRSELRSDPHRNVVEAIQSLLATWRDIGRNETERLQATVQRIITVASIINISPAILEQGMIYEQQYGLKSQDAIVYASVIAHMQRQASSEVKCFVSTNSKDFDYKEIKTELGLYNCRYISKFGNGLEFIQSQRC